MQNTCDSYHGLSSHVRKFTRQDLDLNPSKLTHANIKLVSNKLSANVITTHSILSDGRQRLLGLAVLPSIFNSITNITFTRPVNLAPRPIIPTNASFRAVLVSQERCTKALYQLKEVEESDQVIKTQFLKIFDENHFKNLKNVSQVI